jgi:hypothetical protein
LPRPVSIDVTLTKISNQDYLLTFQVKAVLNSPDGRFKTQIKTINSVIFAALRVKSKIGLKKN